MTLQTNTDRFSAALDYALTTAPFYRRWRSLDPGPQVALAERMAALPALTKRDLRAFGPDGFVGDTLPYREALASGQIEMVTTSGTSEERLSVLWHQVWWDRSEREAARLNGALDPIFGQPHREAVLTSPVCGGNLCHVGDAPMAERTLGNLLFLNQSPDPTSWDERNIRRMAEELAGFQPSVLEADPAYLAVLASRCLAGGYSLWQPECIVLTYEFPSRMHLRQIRRSFPGVPVVSSYGSTETGHVLMQCENGRFHQNTATCHLDVQRLRPEHGDATIGRLLVSTLDNPWLMLLRYDVGDLVRMGLDCCSCDRSEGLIVESVEGRTRDVTFDSAGRVVTLKMLDDRLAVVDTLNGYHLLQAGPHDYRLRYSSEGGGDESAALVEIMRSVYGKDSRIEVRRDSALPPEQSGKFRLAHAAFKGAVEELFV